MRKIIPYSPKLKTLARNLRNDSTKSEIILWNELKGKKIRGYRFIRQKPLLDFIVDFYCYDLNLVIEIDGISHDSEIKFEHDKLRDKKLAEYELTTLRFTDSEIFNDLSNVLRVIENYMINFTSIEFDGFESV